jgi:ribose/xylose/arabinose/galactoside ABC-type transport system permease subunit
MKFIRILTACILSAPLLASAVPLDAVPALTANLPITTLSGLILKVQSILNGLIPFIIGLAVFVIIWGVFKFITQASDEDARKEAKDFVLWGIIGIFIMLSIWGLVNILVNTFPLNRTFNKNLIPRVPAYQP